MQWPVKARIRIFLISTSTVVPVWAKYTDWGNVFMKFWRDESGQTLVLTAISMLVLMGFLAMATDVSILFHDRREMQSAADAGALAATLEMEKGGTSSQIVTAADTAGSSNGFTDGSNGVTIAVHTPPISGYHQSSGYVEVDITQASIPTVLMGLFGQKYVSVATRAVAGITAASTGCGTLLGTSGTDMTLRGSATIISPSCGWNVASTSSDSVDTTGNGNTIDAAFIATDGGFGGSGTPQGTTTITNTAPVSDPFGTIVSSGEPSLSACTNSNTTAGSTFSGTIDASSLQTTTTDSSGNTVITPGVWCFSGTNVNISGANLNNGVFLFENGVQISVNTTASISNGTLDLYNGVFQEPSNSTLNIQAPRIAYPTSQWNNGIALLVPTTNTTYTDVACSANANDYTQELVVQFGNTGETWTGYIYAPDATVSLHDQGGSTTAAGLVSASLCDLSSTLDIINYNQAYAQYAPLRVVALVE